VSPAVERHGSIGVLAAAGAAVALLVASSASAQTPNEDATSSADRAMPTSGGDDAGMDMAAMQGGDAPADARDPHSYAEGVPFTRGAAHTTLADVESFGSVLVDNLEAIRTSGDTAVPYDIEAWFGRTYDRAVLKAEGDIESGDIADGRTELLWGHAVAPYWDTQFGIRYDNGEGPNRDWLAFGVEGLAPYWFDLEITGYLGESSRAALRIEASYEMLITQKWVLQPKIEANFYGQRDTPNEVGSGLSDVSAALRLRYEIRREFAPYLGIEWTNRYGDTKRIVRAVGEDPSDTRVVAGLRFWF
jgi:copper resistance protein B